jgi:hypothetical protein
VNAGRTATLCRPRAATPLPLKAATLRPLRLGSRTSPRPPSSGP